MKPAKYWSDLTEEELKEDIASMIARPTTDIAEAWTEEPEGEAFARLTDGRVVRFWSDGTVAGWEEVKA